MVVFQCRRQVAGHPALLEPADELGGRRDADVRGDQRFLEPLPGLVVGGIEGGRRQLRCQRAAAFPE